jgi:hypothetical protein
MSQTPTGRMVTHQPETQRLKYTGTLLAFWHQCRAAQARAQAEHDLDEIEDRCIRMFGGDVTYIHDERIIHHG